MRKNFVIEVGPVKLNITPFGFHKYATDYLDTANRWTSDVRYSPVPYFLYCRALELGLKAFLLAKGKRLDWVKNELGHDLTKALKKARSNYLDDLANTTDEEEREILIANKYYKSKGFEYFFVSNHVTGLDGLPNLEIIKNYSMRLLNVIKHLTDNTDVD